jgi:hypothetical protein
MPYREVRWDTDTESAARIAANAAGGEFDQVMLGKVLAHLERRQYPIEDTLLDPSDIQKAVLKFESQNKGAFDEGTESVDSSVSRKCPRCGFSFKA